MIKSNVFFDGLFWKLLYCRSSLSRVHFEIIRCLGVGHVQCFLIPTFSVWSDMGVQGDSSRNAILLCFIPTQSPPFQVSDLRRSTSVIWAVTARQPARVVNPTSGATQLPASSWTSFHWASCKIWIQTGSTASILYLTSFHVILQYLILRNISFVQGRRHSHFTCQSRASISFALILWRTTWRAISCNIVQYYWICNRNLTAANLASASFAQSLADLCSVSVAESKRMMALGRKALEGQSCWASRMPSEKYICFLDFLVLSLPPVHSTKETTPMLHTSQRSSYLPKRTCAIVQSCSFCAKQKNFLWCLMHAAGLYHVDRALRLPCIWSIAPILRCDVAWCPKHLLQRSAWRFAKHWKTTLKTTKLCIVFEQFC